MTGVQTCALPICRPVHAARPDSQPPSGADLSMKAIRMSQPGGPEVLQVVDLDTPEPGNGQVLVRNQAIGIGMPDIMVRRGIYPWMPQLPAIPGIESAGCIEQVGAGVTQWSAGQAVYINARDLPERAGGYAEFQVVPAHALQALPPGTDPSLAAAIGNYQVAESLLRAAGALPPGAVVAIIGAAGGVGTALLELSLLRGLRVVAVAGTDEKCQWLADRGAHATINHTTGPVGAAIARACDSDGASAIFDPVGGATLPSLFEALAPLGTVVSYGGLGGPRDPSTVAAMMKRFGDSPALRLFSMHTWDKQPEVRREISARVIGLLGQGLIRPAIHARLPLNQAREAHVLFESARHIGKIVLIPALTGPDTVS